MIYTELNGHSFAYELSANKDNGFSYEGARTLYNYLGDCEFEGEFDPVALRCQFSEYTNEDLVRDYWYAVQETEGGDRDEYIAELIEYLEENTTIIKINDNSYIIDTEF